MTSYTASIGIPYPDPADSSCTVDDQLEAAAEVIGSVLDGIDTTLTDKVNVPMFMVSLAPGGVIKNYNSYTNEDDRLMVYDTVDFDPNGITDLSRDNHTVLLPDCGLALMGSFVMIGGMPAGSRHQLYPFGRVDIGDAMFLGTSGSSDPAGGYMISISTIDAIATYYRNSSATATGTSVRSSMWGIRLSRTSP